MKTVEVCFSVGSAFSVELSNGAKIKVWSAYPKVNDSNVQLIGPMFFSSVSDPHLLREETVNKV